MSDWQLPAFALLAAVGVAGFIQLGRRTQGRRTESENRLRRALESSHLALWEYDVRTGDVTLSEAWSRMLGGDGAKTRTTVHALAALVPPEDRLRILASMVPALKGEKPSYAVEHRVRSLSGEPIWILCEGQVVERGPDGLALRAVGTNRDVTERKRAEAAQGETVSLLAATIEATADGILVVTAEGRIARFNRRFVDMWGLPQDIIDSRDDHRALTFVLDQVKDPGAFLAKVEELYAHPREESFDAIEFKDGRIFERYSCPQLVGGEPAGRVWSFRDVTERKRAEERIQFLAFQDSLTELPNRVLFRDRVGQAIARADRAGTRLALLFLDLDNFKTINDSLGHFVGDALLRMVADRLRLCVRETDTISRQGGDEFLILLTELGENETATPVVDKVMEAFRAPFPTEAGELKASVSIGISMFPDDGRDFDNLLKKADTAMYRAKDAGRSAYRFFNAHMDTEAVERLSLRNGLRLALERSEFVLHYQPRVDLHSGKVVGAEALLRWNHPERGLLAPGVFIGAAEESGLIVEVGEWVLQEACRHAAHWHENGMAHLTVAVNLSAVQFLRGDLESTVERVLARSGLEPGLLELELTESILIRDTETTLATVKRLKALGVRLSIDDFGTGYSSLSYLKRFAVDRLKIDRSFIHGLDLGSEDAAIVRAIVQMAHSLELRTIAEGVENERHLAMLRQFGCDEAQGYFFAAPMTMQAITRHFARPGDRHAAE
jgi:diguanylate cyclase (GGDEF)-like protein/PAS domain S-box-containing protein